MGSSVRLRRKSSAAGKWDVSDPSIFLADDNAAVLDHVRKILESDGAYNIVGATVDGATVVPEYFRLRPEIIVLDISMGKSNGIEIARELRSLGCTAKIVFLTVHGDQDYVDAAVGAGGSAYVTKSRMNLDLKLAIQAVRADRLFVSSNLMYETP